MCGCCSHVWVLFTCVGVSMRVCPTTATSSNVRNGGVRLCSHISKHVYAHVLTCVEGGAGGLEGWRVGQEVGQGWRVELVFEDCFFFSCRN